MDKTIGIIASDEELKSRIIELFKDEVEKDKIIIDVLDLDLMDEQGRELERKGAKAIIARSGGYRHTMGTVSVPVIHLEVSTPDVLQAIKIAQKYEKKLVLVIADLDYFDYDEWKDLINVEIILERFHSKDEIYSRVYKYMENKDDVVIVGGGIPCSFAEDWGMDNVFINASKESIYNAVNYATWMIENLYEQKYNNQALKTILDGLHDSVITVNYQGEIKIYNDRAEELLKKNKDMVIDKRLVDVLPEFDFILDVLRNKVDIFNEIINIGDITITANTSIFNVEGKVEGAVCSFQDISKLQSLEKKIRYELNKKGHVAKYVFDDVLAFDPIMKAVIAKSKKIGKGDNTAIIYGESGTGKEIIAQSMHNISERNKEPFVAINCAAISENLLESELFGYEEGAFTGARKGGKPGLFELAHGGSIFLDEINSISFNLQSKLLRVLEERETMRIGSDYIIPLFNHYLEELSAGEELYEISKDIQDQLLSYQWPGNARELRNIAKRYLIFKEIDLDEVEIMDKEATNEIIDLKEINRFVEEKVIDMLTNQGMSKTKIAETLGISRTTLWNKMKEKD